ncbi:hypothetical protein LX77_02960 [Gelidibacter algens]|uniref:Uncharacterized protein n=1 Tax=Gelidibacter algens TaxID=49280 RepID=A0A1A7R0C8_9FLAO|nr:hypothetical protein [Gelidibacter algens]OBX25266.1 hypothetical protein A9996_11125 [Gelidibacter algens]RAJ20966.1 hypothetical protein LX77_02960 [Gelidibacter algens]
MKKTIGLFILAFIISQNSHSQKLYIWCQKDQIPTPRSEFLADSDIDLVIFDGRIMTSNSKIECTSQTIKNNLSELIRLTYPSAQINLLETDKYFENAKKNKITIKITISAYHAAFGGDVKLGIGSVGGQFSWGIFPEGKWNATTGYSIKIYDYRDINDNKFSKEIGKIVSRPNTGGYRTAKNILNNSYIEANQELFSFIDNSLME